MMNEFLQYIQYEKNYSSHTVLSYRNDISQFLDFVQKSPSEFKPQDVTALHIRQWIVELVNQGVSHRSLSRKMSSLKSFWRFMLRYGYTTGNPTLKIILPKTNKPLPVFFRETEVERVLENQYQSSGFAKQRNVLVVKILYLTGMRESEMIHLKDGDLDCSACCIKVLGKRNKQRIIPVSDELCDEINSYIDLRNETFGRATDYLFVSNKGAKMYPSLLYNIVRNEMAWTTNQKKRSPHVMRHTFATSMLNGGAELNVVKEMLGHSSLAATQVYTHTSFDEIHKIYNQSHPRAK